MISGFRRSPGEGNDDPLQYSCLGNPTDRGAWGYSSWDRKRVGQNLATKQQNNLLVNDPTSQPAALFLTLNVLVGLPSDPPDSASGVQGTQVFKVPGSARGPSRAGGAASVQASAERQQSVNSLIFPLALFLFIYFFLLALFLKLTSQLTLLPLGSL